MTDWMTTKQVLLNPGPTNVSDAVRAAMAGPDWCHREPEFYDLQDETRRLLLEAFHLQTADWTSVLLTGSGTSAVEAMLSTAVPRGGRLLVLDNGVYGDRMAQMARVHEIDVEVLRASWFERHGLGELEERLANSPALATVAMVHHETTTGLLNDVAAVGAITRRHGRTLLVDAVSSLGGEALDVAGCGAHFIACTANKCVQGLPGIAFVLARRDALAAIPARNARTLYLDLTNLATRQDRRDTPFTPAVQVMMAMRQALSELVAETLEARVARYAGYACTVRDALASMSLPILVEPELRSSTITTIALPKGRSYDDLHDAFKRERFVIYAGQGDLRARAFRIATMGNIEPATLERAMEVLRSLVKG